MMIWIDKLRRDHALAPDEYRQLLATTDTDAVEYLHRQAREVALRQFGHDIYIRGLIEGATAVATIATIAAYGQPTRRWRVTN